MIIVMQAGASEAELAHVVARIEGLGLRPHVIVGTERTVVAVVGDERGMASSGLETLPGVAAVMPILAPYTVASREVLLEILAKANPDGKLVYIVREEDGVETILVTTRAAVQKRGDKLPPGLEPPAEEKKNKA